MGLLAATSGIRLTIPLLAGAAINTIQLAGPNSLSNAGLLILAIFGVHCAMWALHFPGRILERNVAVRVRAALADSLYQKLVALPLGWHESRHSGEIHYRAQQATRALYEFTQTQFMYLQAFINLVGPVIALTLLSGMVGGIAICGYLVLGTMIVRFDQEMMRLQRLENAADRRYVAGLLDFLGNISTVMALRLESASRALVASRLSKVFEPIRRHIVVNETKWCAIDLLCVALTWTLVVVFAWQSYRAGSATGGTILIGSIFMIYQYANQAAAVVSTMAQNYQVFTRIKTDVGAAEPIWKADPRPTSTAAIRPDWKEIEARGLSFIYETKDRAAGIRDVAFTLKRGERVAIIGPSGSGKSTLLRLIAGLYEPQHGFYTVDGETVFGARHLAAIATLIPQETEIFEASARENLTFGAGRDEAAIQRAARISAFDSVLATLPLGLDTQISERGFNLSGGQRQRLALARGLLAAEKSSILLLDEPTSALDQATEAQIFQRLRESHPDTTIVAAVHRMSALAHFDRVFVMEEGKLSATPPPPAHASAHAASSSASRPSGPA